MYDFEANKVIARQIEKLISLFNSIKKQFCFSEMSQCSPVSKNLIVKRNNLIFYGIPNEPREKEHALIGKVTFSRFYDR